MSPEGPCNTVVGDVAELNILGGRSKDLIGLNSSGGGSLAVGVVAVDLGFPGVTSH